MAIVRVGAINRIAQNNNDLRIRLETRNLLSSKFRTQIRRRCFPCSMIVWGPFEEFHILSNRTKLLQGMTILFLTKKPWFFGFAHMNFGVFPQVGIQRGCPTLCGTYDKKVWLAALTIFRHWISYHLRGQRCPGNYPSIPIGCRTGNTFPDIRVMTGNGSDRKFITDAITGSYRL